MIHVLVAEDSPTARALLVKVLESDPEIRVVGEAKDGVEAVELTRMLRPDLITMDIHMPRMDGLAATREIMRSTPTPIVIVTGSTRAREVESSLLSLNIGALDVLKKLPAPSSPGFAAASRALVATVRAMSQVKVVRHWHPDATRAPAPVVPPGARGRIVAVAASTGGPPALQQLFSGLPDVFSTPILVVQHITPGFTTGLADWLDANCPLRVAVARAGEVPGPRTVSIAPDGRHLGVSARGELVLSDAPPIGGFRPSGTFLFESVAKAFGPSAVGIILTGMGEDGVAGLRAVRRSGGRVIAQDRETSVVFGMPGAAIDAGVADVILPLGAIAARLAEMA